jgi:hypothetical protein
MLDIIDKDDRALLDEFVTRYGIRNLWPSQETLDALKLINKYKPLKLLEIGYELSDTHHVSHVHGRRTTYVNYRCHGILCKHANKMYKREGANLTRLNDGIDDALSVICEAHELSM